MKGYILNIEEKTLQNTNYREVLYTAKHCQLVLMSIEPNGEIGEEVHHLDQFIRVEAGEAKVILNGESSQLSADMAVIIPEGVKHNIINTGSVPLKLYTLYSPPEHKNGTIQKTKADEREEHFDGTTSE